MAPLPSPTLRIQSDYDHFRKCSASKDDWISSQPATTPANAAPGETSTPLPLAGAPTSAAASPAPGEAPATSEFELAWQDDFDTFDASRWRLMTHSWDTNLAQFSTENVRVEQGLLSLLLTPQPSDPAKPFRGVEMRSIDTLTYGKVEARVRLARGSGVVSSLVLLYTPWPADDWNELDVEYLGRYSDRIQFNTMVYTGAPTQPPVQVSVSVALCATWKGARCFAEAGLRCLSEAAPTQIALDSLFSVRPDRSRFVMGGIRVAEPR